MSTSTTPLRVSKRIKLPTTKNNLEILNNNEYFELQKALKNSSIYIYLIYIFFIIAIPIQNMRSGDLKLLDAPAFYPTDEEFMDPMKYINSIKSLAEPFGICKIIPPSSFKKEYKFKAPVNKFKTREQLLSKIQEAVGFEDGPDFNYNEFKEFADNFKTNYMKQNKVEDTDIEKEYWKIIETSQPVTIYYGSDIPTNLYGSGFDNNCNWNMPDFPLLKSGILRYLDSNINGVTQPWMYIGMMFASFCWHCEDEYLPSINFMHLGDTKTWYGIAPSQANAFENAVYDIIPSAVKAEPDLIFQLVTLISPAQLMARKVNVFKLEQNAGEFVITWPQAFHAGFSHGFNCGEAVNFGADFWIPFGKVAAKKYKRMGRETTFSHEHLLLSTILNSETGEFDRKTLHNEIKLLAQEEENIRDSAREFGINFYV